ncbi:MAG: alpha/beta hydrolase, partial [Bacteroidota bacterium]
VSSTMKSGTTKHKFTKEELEVYWRPFRNNGKYVIRNFFGSMKMYPTLLKRMQEHIRSNPKPTCIIWGAKDKFLRKEQVPFIMDTFKVPSADVHIMFEQKHFLQEQAPVEVSNFILSFLAK